MGIGQSTNSDPSIQYDPSNLSDLAEARKGFLNQDPYNTPLEPTLPWGEEFLTVTPLEIKYVPSGPGMLGDTEMIPLFD